MTLETNSVNLDGDNPFIQIEQLNTITIATDRTMKVPAIGGLKNSIFREKKDEEGVNVEVYQFATLVADELAYTGQENGHIAKRVLAELQSRFVSVIRNLVVIGFDNMSD